MIQIVVRIVPNGNERRAFEHAGAEVVCIAGDEPFADYSVTAGENQNPVTGAFFWSAQGHIFRHDRRSSVWSLVRKVAELAEREADKAAG